MHRCAVRTIQGRSPTSGGASSKLCTHCRVRCIGSPAPRPGVCPAGRFDAFVERDSTYALGRRRRRPADHRGRRVRVEDLDGGPLNLGPAWPTCSLQRRDPRRPAGGRAVTVDGKRVTSTGGEAAGAQGPRRRPGGRARGRLAPRRPSDDRRRSCPARLVACDVSDRGRRGHPARPARRDPDGSDCRVAMGPPAPTAPRRLARVAGSRTSTSPNGTACSPSTSEACSSLRVGRRRGDGRARWKHRQRRLGDGPHGSHGFAHYVASKGAAISRPGRSPTSSAAAASASTA